MKEFKRSPAQEAAFQHVKREMCGDVALAFIDYEKPMVLKSETSQIGYGATKVNRVDGRDRTIAFVSKRFKKSETNEPIYEKEAFAISWTYRKLVDFLRGHKLTVQTHCSCVQFVKILKDKKPKNSHWALGMSSWAIKYYLLKEA